MNSRWFEKLPGFLKPTPRQGRRGFAAKDKFLLLLGSVYFALFNLVPIFVYYQVASGASRIHMPLSSYLLVMVPIYLLISFFTAALLISHKILFYVLGPILFLLSGITSYYIYHFHISFTGELANAVMSSDRREMMGFIEPVLFAWLALVSAVFLLLALYARRRPGLFRFNPVSFFFILIVCLVFGIKVGVGVPYNVISSFASYEFDAVYKKKADAHRANLALRTTGHDEALLKDTTIVFVIGEAARPDHFHLNGYARETTPELEKIPDLVDFPHVEACANNTNEAVPCLLTRATRENRAPVHEETSFLSIFKALGLSTYWLSNNNSGYEQNLDVKPISTSPLEVTRFYQNENNDHEFALTKMTDAKSRNQQFRALDEDLLPLFDQLLASHPGRLLVVLHSGGSHWPYHAHFTDADAPFAPFCEKNSPTQCGPAEKINAYDDTIRVTDRFLSEIIARLQNRKALFVYISDHGELLGERGYWGHLMPDTGPEQYRIPMLWWVSKSLQQDDPTLLRALKSHTQDSLAQSVIFHSLLDCMGIKSPVINRDLSLCR